MVSICVALLKEALRKISPRVSAASSWRTSSARAVAFYAREPGGALCARHRFATIKNLRHCSAAICLRRVYRGVSCNYVESQGVLLALRCGHLCPLPLAAAALTHADDVPAAIAMAQRTRASMGCRQRRTVLCS